MKPVKQRRLWQPDDHPDGLQRGDCLAACVASVFELPYEECADIGPTSQSLYDWMRERFPGVDATYRILTDLRVPETLDSWREWPTHHYEPGFWIATIKSPRIPDVEQFGCGCAARVEGGDPACRWCHGEPDKRSMGIQWGLHAVVMEGGRLAWDPHPEADPDAPLIFRGATAFRVSDPARLVVAEGQLAA